MNSLSFLSNCSFPIKWRGGVLLLKRQMQKKKKEANTAPRPLRPHPRPTGEQYPYSKSHWISPSWNTLTTLRLNMLFFFFNIYNVIVWR